MKRSVMCLVSITATASLLAVSPRAEEPVKPVPASPAPGAVAAVSAPALLSVEKDVIDLGEVMKGAKAEASFVLRNTGTRPVKILSAKPG